MLRAELVLIVAGRRSLRVLMMGCERPSHRGVLVLPGGYLREETSLDNTVEIMRIKLGLPQISFELAGLYTSPDRDPRARLASAAYMAIITQDKIDGWVADNPDFRLPVIVPDSYPEVRLRYDGEIITPGFDHAQMIADAVRYMRRMLDNSRLAFSALESPFTLLELQKVHELISGTEIEKVRFRKRMLARTFPCGARLRPTGQYRQAEGRPAQLYHLG